MIQQIVRIILYALFSQGYQGLRKASLAPPLAQLALYTAGAATPEALLAATAAAYLVTGMTTLLAYATTLASIPAAWMAATQAALDLITHSPPDPTRYLQIYVKALAAALQALYILHSLNPTETAYIIHRLTGSCLAANTPALILKTIAQTLKDAVEATTAHKTRNTPPWATLAILLVRGKELATQLEEATHLKLHHCKPKPVYSKKALVAQTTALALVIALTIAAKILQRR